MVQRAMGKRPANGNKTPIEIVDGIFGKLIDAGVNPSDEELGVVCKTTWRNDLRNYEGSFWCLLSDRHRQD
jgi:hypothetical protein